MGTKKSEWVLFLGFVGTAMAFSDEDPSKKSRHRMMDFSRELQGFLWGRQASGDLRFDCNQQVSQTPSTPPMTSLFPHNDGVSKKV